MTFANAEINVMVSNDAKIIFSASESDEMLRITKDGFWVRGVKVPQDENEALAVYEAFKNWVIYYNLTRDY